LFQGQFLETLRSNEELPPSLGGRYTPTSKVSVPSFCIVESGIMGTFPFSFFSVRKFRIDQGLI
jgi:hypothetical protein